MQVSVESTSGLGRKLKVEVPASQFLSSYQTRVRDLAKTAKIQGFRPGKVPTQVIEQRYGNKLREEVTMDLIRDSLGTSLDEQKLRPAATPSVTIQSASAQSGVSFEATFDVYPEVGPVEVKDLAIIRENSAIGDEDIDRMIESLKLQRRTWNEVSRGATAGDLVTFELSVEVSGKRVPVEGAERGATIVGSGAVFADIDQALVGMVADENKQFALNYPADFRDPEAAGQTGAASIKVLAVKEAQLPEVDAGFIRSFGVAEGEMDAFRREIRANLERELAAALSARLRAEVLTRLSEAYAGFELPPSMVEQEAKSLRTQAVANAKRNGNQVNEEPPLDGYMEAAARRVRAGILLEEIARQNQLSLDPQRVNAAIMAIASTYEDPSEVIAMYRKDERLLAGLRSRVMEEQVADWVASHASTTDKHVSFAEIVQARG